MEARQFDTNYIDAELKKLSAVLKKDVKFFIAGGFVMAMLDLKVGTKDLDVVTKSTHDTHILIRALSDLNYCPLRTEALEDAYRSLAAKIYQNADGFQWDIFTLRIADKLELSSGMIERSEEYFEKEKLQAYVLSKEDVFLLKSVADRDRDLEDMALLARSGIEYEVVFRECERQTEITERPWEPTLLEKIEDLEAQYNIRVPFKKRLIDSTDECLLFNYVKNQTKDGPVPLDRIVADLVKQGIKESDIMPTIESLVRKKRIKRLRDNLVSSGHI